MNPPMKMTLLTQNIGIAAEKAVAQWCSYNTLRPKISSS